MDFVLGYTVANDISARLWQTDQARTAGQWNREKASTRKYPRSLKHAMIFLILSNSISPFVFFILNT